ncbi:lipoprotein [Longispora fulva]|uniref:Lysophospholipase L1-like esterase n=1 Tax=Longispora fulva TaxID=619741 RepID=A0A8J7GQR8_9ACTN|nr:GDSL-type esterase/lipase family protein [Longispora fulva]MBG6141593.1 lysophospholipase L1-like esterase [Longispora fulva]GIG59254.1 lipoprotein [Longispora fulva]
MRRPLLAALLPLLLAGCTATPATPDATPTTTVPITEAPRPAKVPGPVVALGDSITRGVNACSDKIGDCPEASWSTGTTLDSHAHKVGQPGTNLANSGARVADLPGQAESAAAVHPAYVTILIGANDACRQSADRMTSTTAFKADLAKSLATIRKGAPDAKLLLASVPDLYQLWSIGHADQRATQRWGLGICPSMLANPGSTAAEDERRRQSVRDRVVAYNDVIAVACKDYGSNCRTDGGAVFRFQFRPEHVSSIDYFHPSALGQAELARVTNEAGYRW